MIRFQILAIAFFSFLSSTMAWTETLRVESIPNVEIYVDGSYSTITDAEGVATVTVASGRHEVYAVSSDYSPLKQSINVPKGKNPTINFQFKQETMPDAELTIIQVPTSQKQQNGVSDELTKAKLRKLDDEASRNTPCLSYDREKTNTGWGVKEQVVIRCVRNNSSAHIVQGLHAGGPYMPPGTFDYVVPNLSALLSRYKEMCGCSNSEEVW